MVRDKETARLASGELIRRWEPFRQQAVANLETIIEEWIETAIELDRDIPSPSAHLP